jgi:hypothetical protein
MAGSLLVSMPPEPRHVLAGFHPQLAELGVAVSMGGYWYELVVVGARNHFPAGSERYIEEIYGAGDLSGENLANLVHLSAQGFNLFYGAIRRSIEQQAKKFFDERGMPRPTRYGADVDEEIITKLEADPRFDPDASKPLLASS